MKGRRLKGSHFHLIPLHFVSISFSVNFNCIHFMPHYNLFHFIWTYYSKLHFIFSLHFKSTVFLRGRWSPSGPNFINLSSFCRTRQWGHWSIQECYPDTKTFGRHDFGWRSHGENENRLGGTTSCSWKVRNVF